jgi:hypothetical protein
MAWLMNYTNCSVVTHLLLMHVVKVELDSICEAASVILLSFTVNAAATRMVINAIIKSK